MSQRDRVSLIGVPSSAGAYAPGQEKAPQALRDAGLVKRINKVGPSCGDLGDLRGFRWRPDLEMPSAQNLDAVVKVATAVKDAVAKKAPDEIASPPPSPAAPRSCGRGRPRGGRGR